MRKYINDKSPYGQSIDDLDAFTLDFEGHDKPRFILPANDESGALGLEDWGTSYVNKPTGVAAGSGGSLTVDKWYSIVVAPAKSNTAVGGQPIYGEATMPSMPIQAAADDKITYTIPVFTQQTTKVVGSLTAQDGTTLTDTTMDWGIDEHDGRMLLNVETGVSVEILSNTATVITTAAHSFSASDRYAVTEDMVQERVIYAVEMASASDVTSSTFYTRAVVTDNSSTEYILTAYAEGTALLDSGYYLAPPNCNSVKVVNGTMFCGGGIEDTGTCTYDGTETNYQAVDLASALAFAIIDDDYTNAGTARIMKLTPGSAHADFADVYVGSYVTISGSEQSGNDGEFRILDIDTDGEYITYLNNDGVTNTDDETSLAVTTANVMDGTTFTEGMVDAKFTFDDDSIFPMTISWVDVINQQIGLSRLYNGVQTTASEYQIISDYQLYYSASKNPFAVPSGNTVDIFDRITGLESIEDYLIVFCETSIWRVLTTKLGSAPVLLSDNIRCPAQFSIAKGQGYIMFYDGDGLSITDGVKVESITTYKARDYFQNINRNAEAGIQGVYDRANKRFEYAFPFGSETNNNYGIIVTEGSWGCFPVSRPDCNALWMNYEEGVPYVFHGTTGDYTGDPGIAWKHTGATDGLGVDDGYYFEIMSVVGQVITMGGESTTALAAGDLITVYPISGDAEYKEMIVDSISAVGTATEYAYEYTVTMASDYDLTDYADDDVVVVGLIPFTYGIKWTDFSSPQYLHQVRALQIDVQNYQGILYIDQYLEMNDNPAQTNGYSVAPDDTKIVVPFRYGKGYKYGFRMRGLSLTEMKVNSFEIMFDTQA